MGPLAIADRTIGNLSDCLDPMLRMLPDADAGLLRRIDLEEEPQTALAASIVPLSTLKSRVQRARRKLRSAFDACCAGDLARNGAPIAFERRDACAPSCAGDDKTCVDRLADYQSLSAKDRWSVAVFAGYAEARGIGFRESLRDGSHGSNDQPRDRVLGEETLRGVRSRVPSVAGHDILERMAREDAGTSSRGWTISAA